MSLSAAVLRELMAAGLSGDALLAACERIEESCPVEAGPLRSARQERNRRYYVSKRLKASYSDVSDANSDGVIPPEKKVSPDPSKKTTPLSSEPSVLRCDRPRRHFWPEGFADLVWSIYPRKTEKQAGMLALAKLHQADRLDWQILTDGIRGLAAAVEDPKFAPALHRWLRAERWNDQYPDRQARAGPQPKTTFGQLVREATAEKFAGHPNGQQIDIDADHDGQTLDFGRSSSAEDHYDLQPARAGGVRF